MKELNIVQDNVSLVFEGNKIHLSRPTENQNEILECKNSMEIINNTIEETRKTIKENQKKIDKYKGKSIPVIIGLTLSGFLIGTFFKCATGIDVIPELNNISTPLMGTLLSVPISICVATITINLKNKYLKENKVLRAKTKGYRKLLNTKENELRVLYTFDKEINQQKNYVSVDIIDTTRKSTLKQLKEIKDFYSTKNNPENEWTSINLENNGTLILKKRKK